MSRYDDRSAHWLQNFILNSIVRVSVESPYRQYIFNLLRRSVDCFREHDLARAATGRYLEGVGAQRRDFAEYFLALHHWEGFLSAVWHVHAVFGKLVDEKPYERNDGSLAESVNHMYNRLKHADSAIEHGQLPSDGTLPVWLSNEGLVSVDHLLRWRQTAEILEEIAGVARLLENPPAESA